MAVDRRRIYFNTVLGGIGGLIGWAGITPVQRILPADTGVYLRDAYLGLVIGAAIGAALGCAEGLIESPSARRALLGGGLGALIGAIGGVIGLVLGEVLFGLAQGMGIGGVWPRSLGWAIFGGVVGTADGIARRMPGRVRYGVIGGVIGGLIGGSTYDRRDALFGGLPGDTAAWGAALGLIVLGACIGLMIGLVESLLRTAWVTFLGGRFEGQSRTIDPARAETTIGSSDSCNVLLLGDKTVAPLHAAIIVRDGVFLLETRGGPVTVQRGEALPPAMSYALQAGDRIVLGATRLLFQSAEVRRS